MKYLTEFTTDEKIAIEIIVYCLSTSNKKLKINQKYIQNSIVKTFYSKTRAPEETKQQVLVPFNIVENGDLKKGNAEYGNIFDDLNYGDAFMMFRNPLKLSDKEKWEKIKSKKIMKIYRNYLLCEGMSNPVKNSYLEGEKLALLNLLEICKSYEIYYKDKQAPDLEDEFENQEENKNKIKTIFDNHDPDSNLGYKKVSEFSIKRGLESFFKEYFNELFFKKSKEVKIENEKEKSRRKYEKKKPKKKKTLIRTRAQFSTDVLKKYSLPKVLFDYFMMKLIILKMNNLQIFTRSFFSDDLKNIYIVIKPLESILSRKAENDRLKKEVEIGSVDVLSLQPVDKKLRPLITKPYYFKELMKIDREVEINDPRILTQSVGSVRAISKYLSKVKKMHYRMLRDHLKKIIREHQQTTRELLKKANKNKRASHLRIIDNPLLSRRKWEAMYIYCRVLRYWANRIKSYATHDKFHVYYPLLLRLVHLKAIGDTNAAFMRVEISVVEQIQNYLLEGKKVLKNIWDRLKLEAISPYVRYKADRRFLKLYKNYQVNEEGERSIFMPQERIKLLFRILNDTFNLQMLLKTKLLMDISPLHDVYTLLGIKKKSLLRPVLEDIDTSIDFENNPLIQTEKRHERSKLDELFDSLSYNAMPSDFMHKSLAESCSFNLKTLTGLPFQDIKYYFGEKIALYFMYLSFQCNQMIWISIVLFILERIRRIMIGNGNINGEKRVFFFMSLMNIIWSTVFVETWKKRQSLYALQNGMSDFKQREVDRPNYKAKIVRDISSNVMNIRVNDKFKRSLKMAINILIALLITSLGIVTVFILLWFKFRMKENDFSPFWYKVIPITLNVIQITTFNFVLSFLSKRGNKFENHKYRSSYENSYIVKLTLFTIVSSCSSLFIIAFIKGQFDIDYLKECIGTPDADPQLQCYEEVSTQLSFIFTCSLFINLVEIIVPFLLLIWKKRNKRFEIREYDFGALDRYILKESLKEDYKKSFDLDGTLGDYMSLVVEFCFLSFFGVCWPFSFILALISDIIQVHVDKLKLFYLLRRPIPTGASGIGTWLKMIDIISYGSICVNAALVIFTKGNLSVDQNKLSPEEKAIESNKKFEQFVLLMLLLYLVKAAAKNVLSKIPDRFLDIKKRQDLLLANIFTKEKSTVRLNMAKTGLNQRIRPNEKIMQFRCDPKKIINTQEVSVESDIRTSEIFELGYEVFDEGGHNIPKESAFENGSLFEKIELKESSKLEFGDEGRRNDVYPPLKTDQSKIIREIKAARLKINNEGKCGKLYSSLKMDKTKIVEEMRVSHFKVSVEGVRNRLYKSMKADQSDAIKFVKKNKRKSSDRVIKKIYIDENSD